MTEPEKTEDQKQIEAHLLAVGRCINQWAMLETQLFRLFSLALNSREDFAAIIFYKDHAFRTKLDLTDEIVDARLGVGTVDASKWVALCNRIRKKSKYRNLAAHFALRREQRISIGPEGIVENTDTGYLASKRPDRLKRPRETEASIDIEGLTASARAAIELHHELAAFADLVKEKLRPRP